MAAFIGSDDGMYARDQWSAAQVASASQKLLAELWKKHPRILRIAHRQGRAVPVLEAVSAFERKRASHVEFECYNNPLPKPPVPVEPVKPEDVYDRRPETGMRLVQSVADDFAISYGELIGEGRSRHLVEARVVVVAVLRERGWSFPRIGKLIGGRDHSTIIWAHQNFDIHAKRNPRVLNLYKQYRPDSPVEVAR